MPAVATRPSEIRFATYNFEDFGTAKKPESKAALATTLKSLNADVVAFEEVKDEASLDQFVTADLANEYPFRAVFPSPGSGQNTGVMSKFPLSDIHSNRDNPAFQRDLGQAEINVPGYPIRLYVGHLKANPYFKKPGSAEKTKAAEAKRSAEVGAIHDVLVRDMPSIPDEHYVVAGDMNAPPDTAEMVKLFDPSSPSPLIDTMAGRNTPDDISHPATGHRFDYLGVSPQMDKDVTAVGVYHGAPEAEALASDHLPLVMTIKTGN